MAVAQGANALGLVSAMPSGPGAISEERIAEVAASVPAHIATFLLTSRERGDEIVEQLRRMRTTHVQLVDRVEVGAYAAIRRALPQVRIVQVIHVIGPQSVDEACDVAPQVDVLLLDSGNPNLAVKELGGTGRQHDWSLSRTIVERCNLPVFLAGGIHAHNVREAITRVGPHGIDLCSGVRTNDRLDSAKLAALVKAMGQL